MLPPNKQLNANQVCQVNGMFNTGNNVFKLHIPTIGPNITAITMNIMPTTSFNNADVITKNPPTDILTSSLLLPCLLSKHNNLDL